MKAMRSFCWKAALVSLFPLKTLFLSELLFIFRTVFFVFYSQCIFIWGQIFCVYHFVAVSKGKTRNSRKHMVIYKRWKFYIHFIAVDTHKKSHVILNGIRGNTSKWAPFSKTTSCPYFSLKPVHNAIWMSPFMWGNEKHNTNEQAMTLLRGVSRG